MLRFFQPLLALAVLLASGAASAVRAEDENAGISFTLRVQPRTDPASGRELPVAEEDLERASQTVIERLNTIGVADMLVASGEDGTIRLRLPGADDAMIEAVRKSLENPGRLQLHRVHPKSVSLAEPVFEGREVVPGYRAWKHEGRFRGGETFTEFLLVNQRSIVTGSEIAEAWPMTQGPDFLVGVKLDRKGGERMSAATKDIRHGVDRIAVILDGKVLSAPAVMTELGRNFVLMGPESFEDAKLLAVAVAHPFDNPLKIVRAEPIPASPATEEPTAAEDESDSR